MKIGNMKNFHCQLIFLVLGMASDWHQIGEFVQVFQAKYLCFPTTALQHMAMGDDFSKHCSLHPI